MKPLSADSFLARLLGGLAAAVIRYPRWFFYPQVALFITCVFYTAAFLQFDTNRDDLVGAKKKYHQNYLRFKKEFPQQDDLVVVVESSSIEKNRQFVERLGAKMEVETNLFHDVIYQKNLTTAGDKALLWPRPTNSSRSKTALQADLPFIDRFTRATNLVRFLPGQHGVPHCAAHHERADGVLDRSAAGTGTDFDAGHGQFAAARHAALAQHRDAVWRRRSGRCLELHRICARENFHRDGARAR